jgi:hypothetical protein
MFWLLSSLWKRIISSKAAFTSSFFARVGLHVSIQVVLNRKSEQIIFS